VNKVKILFGKPLAKTERNVAATKELKTNWNEFHRMSKRNRAAGYAIHGDKELEKYVTRIVNGLKLPVAATGVVAATGLAGKKLLDKN